MTAHTPGPWRLRGVVPIPIGASIQVLSASGGEICSVPDDDLSNARLIAAAPELLAALRAIVDEHVDVFRYVTPQTGLEIRAALAKAEGRAP